MFQILILNYEDNNILHTHKNPIKIHKHDFLVFVLFFYFIHLFIYFYFVLFFCSKLENSLFLEEHEVAFLFFLNPVGAFSESVRLHNQFIFFPFGLMSDGLGCN